MPVLSRLSVDDQDLVRRTTLVAFEDGCQCDYQNQHADDDDEDRVHDTIRL